MRRELSHAVEVQNATVDTVLPGVNGRFNSLEQSNRQQTEEMKEMRMLMEKVLMNQDTLLATWQSYLSGMSANLSGMSAIVGNVRVATAAGGIAPSAPPAMQQQTSPAAANPRLLSEPIRSFTFESQHNNLKSLWDEWHGLGDFQDSPIAGGVAALEELHGAKWREKNMQQRVSRQGRICLAIKKKSEAESKSIELVCNEWDRKYAVELNKNMRSFVQFLQQENWIPIHSRRGRKSDT